MSRSESSRTELRQYAHSSNLYVASAITSVLSRGGERLEGKGSILNSALSRVEEELPSPLNLIVHGDELCQMTSIPLHNSFVGHLVAPGIKARSISGPVFGTCRCVLQNDTNDCWTAPSEINLNAAQLRLYETIPGAAEHSSAVEDLLHTVRKHVKTSIEFSLGPE